jgi:hypothetical protein
LNFNDFYGNYCMPPVSALLPQFGLYQGLVMAFQARVSFISKPPGYVEEVLMPRTGDGACSGSSCVFPSASRLVYWLSMTFMFIGAILLLLVGYGLAHLFVFPSGLLLSFWQSLDKLVNALCCRKTPELLKDDPTNKEKDFDVVTNELEAVADMARPFVDEPKTMDSNVKVGDRDSTPPVLMHKLRKVYPAAPGGRASAKGCLTFAQYARPEGPGVGTTRQE